MINAALGSPRAVFCIQAIGLTIIVLIPCDFTIIRRDTGAGLAFLCMFGITINAWPTIIKIHAISLAVLILISHSLAFFRRSAASGAITKLCASIIATFVNTKKIPAFGNTVVVFVAEKLTLFIQIGSFLRIIKRQFFPVPRPARVKSVCRQRKGAVSYTHLTLPTIYSV